MIRQRQRAPFVAVTAASVALSMPPVGSMAEIETDLQRAQVTAAGLERWFRRRLRSQLTRVSIGLVVSGGIFTRVTPRPHMLAVALVCISIAALVAALVVLRFYRLRHELRHDPEGAVARITKWRSVNAAGFLPAIRQ